MEKQILSDKELLRFCDANPDLIVDIQHVSY